jgi:glutaredoxin 3
VAKEFLSSHNVPYEERDVVENEAYGRELMALGSTGVPTLVVDGQVVIGFDRPRLSRLLGLS